MTYPKDYKPTMAQQDERAADLAYDWLDGRPYPRKAVDFGSTTDHGVVTGAAFTDREGREHIVDIAPDGTGKPREH